MVVRSLKLARSTFEELVDLAFDFLSDECGFERAELTDGGRVFRSPSFEVAVLFDDHEAAILTLVKTAEDDGQLRADLSCLYSAAGLGPPQRVKRTARTSHTVRASLTSQAAALRELIPVLAGPRRTALLQECHAR